VDVHSVLRGTLKLRNLSFLGSDRMDNLLKVQIEPALTVTARVTQVLQDFV